MDTGSQKLRVGKAYIPFSVYEFGAEISEPADPAEETHYWQALSAVSKDYPAARILPSALAADTDIDGVKVAIIENFHARISIKGNPEMDALGNAIHAYLAADYGSLLDEQRLELAQRLIRRWGMEMSIEASEVAAAGRHLLEFLNRNYVGYKAYREWPIMLRNDQGQLMQGWIDLLLEMPDGYVIIDHKSYPGPDPREWVKKYAPQLGAYKEAVEQATGKPVIDTLIHLPVRGEIIKYL